MRIYKDLFGSLWPALMIMGFLCSPVAAADHSAWQPRPTKLGVSGSNIEDGCVAGTLGSLVKRIGRRGKFILSNNHVLARENDGEKGDLIIQPGCLDSGCGCDAEDKVAKLTTFVPIDFSIFGSNEVDAALAKIIKGEVNKKGKILDIGRVSRLSLDPVVGMAVKKAGRTTDLTFGTIDAIGVTVMVEYSVGYAWFVNQFVVTPGGFSAPGDSGSLIVIDEERCPNPVGLLFAGSETSTVANPIRKVYESFDVRPVGCREEPTQQVAVGEAVYDNALIANAIQIKERHEDSLLRLPGVVGVGVSSE